MTTYVQLVGTCDEVSELYDLNQESGTYLTFAHCDDNLQSRIAKSTIASPNITCRAFLTSTSDVLPREDLPLSAVCDSPAENHPANVSTSLSEQYLVDVRT